VEGVEGALKGSAFSPVNAFTSSTIRRIVLKTAEKWRGSEVAECVARTLGWQLYDDAMVLEVAAWLGLDGAAELGPQVANGPFG
jgi:hypothetical protein